jgi:hypothetical protein
MLSGRLRSDFCGVTQDAFARAEEFFQLGQGILDEVREAASGKAARP